MDNLPRALVMAASTLLAVMVMALMIYAIRHVGILQTQQDENEKTKQLKDFNMEYEAYNKKIMYGVDVLSCLNKARSNNEKYVKGSDKNYFLSGDTYTKEYIIDIAFRLKNELEDKVTVNYLSATKVVAGGVTTSKIAVKETPYTTDKGPNTNIAEGYGGTYKITGSLSNHGSFPASYERVFPEMNEDYFDNVIGSTITFSNTIISKVYKSSKFTSAGNGVDGPYYHLLTASGLNGMSINSSGDAVFVNPKKDYFTNPKTSTDMANLLNSATNLKINVKHTLTPLENKEENATLKFMAWDGNTGSNAGWSSAEWKTALYDFKTRKFKCESMTYSSVTGRVVSMVFAEI